MKRIFMPMICGCFLFSSSFAETDPFKPQADPWMPKGVNSIEKGMTKAEVRAKAGNPDCIIVKSDKNDNPFGEPKGPSKIKEGWIYKSKKKKGYGGEIYFDSNSVVVGENGGFGVLDCANYGK